MTARSWCPRFCSCVDVTSVRQLLVHLTFCSSPLLPLPFKCHDRCNAMTHPLRLPFVCYSCPQFAAAAARLVHFKVGTHRPDTPPYDDGKGPLFYAHNLLSREEVEERCFADQHPEIAGKQDCLNVIKARSYAPVMGEVAALTVAVKSVSSFPSDDVDN